MQCSSCPLNRNRPTHEMVNWNNDLLTNWRPQNWGMKSAESNYRVDPVLPRNINFFLDWPLSATVTLIISHFSVLRCSNVRDYDDLTDPDITLEMLKQIVVLPNGIHRSGWQKSLLRKFSPSRTRCRPTINSDEKGMVQWYHIPFSCQLRLLVSQFLYVCNC